MSAIILNAATTFASVRYLHIPEDYKRCLFERKFQAGIDKAHGGSERPQDVLLTDFGAIWSI